MSLFGLVHGGRSTGQVWRLLVPELEQRGHRTLLVDLPMADPLRHRSTTRTELWLRSRTPASR